jgi:hypothetical protein
MLKYIAINILDVAVARQLVQRFDRRRVRAELDLINQTIDDRKGSG